MPFGDVLELIDHLSIDDQKMLVEIVRRRLAEQGRRRITAEIQKAEQEYAEGRCKTATADEIINEILS
ncbi:MAG: hypothetical protein ABI353_18335 [Isosphaeraceae bacterium]